MSRALPGIVRRRGGASFVPTSLPELVVWNDGETTSALTGGLWENKAPSGANTTCSGMVRLSGLNGKNTITFTVSQTYLYAPNLAAYSIFFVARQTGGANFRIFQRTPFNSNLVLGYWSGRKKVLFIEGNPSFLTGEPSDTNWDIVSHTRTAGSAYTMKWNGSGLYSGATSTANQLSNLAINITADPEVSAFERSDCEVAEIIIYKAVLSPADTEKVEGYLAHKWGQQASLPPGHSFKSSPP